MRPVRFSPPLCGYVQAGLGARVRDGVTSTRRRRRCFTSAAFESPSPPWRRMRGPHPRHPPPLPRRRVPTATCVPVRCRSPPGYARLGQARGSERAMKRSRRVRPGRYRCVAPGLPDGGWVDASVAVPHRAPLWPWLRFPPPIGLSTRTPASGRAARLARLPGESLLPIRGDTVSHWGRSE